MGEAQNRSWAEMSRDEKVAKLQAQEDAMAKEQKRTARTVEAVHMDNPNQMGAYNPDNPTVIRLNEDVIDSSEKEFQCVQTTIHEGRHAYQHDEVTGRDNVTGENRQPKEDKQTLQTWKENFPAENSENQSGCYNSARTSDRPDYRFQAVEDDANQCAAIKMDEQYAGDSQYKEFQAQREIRDLHDHEAAKRMYGENYRQEIQKETHNKYEAQQEKDPNSLSADTSKGEETTMDAIQKNDMGSTRDFLDNLKKAREEHGAQEQTSATNGEGQEGQAPPAKSQPPHTITPNDSISR